MQAAFAGESEARNKYTFFASKAKKEGYVQISNIFAETAANEKEAPEVCPVCKHPKDDFKKIIR